MEIDDKLKEALCVVCGEQDERGEYLERGRLRRCVHCEYAFCIKHGDAHLEECVQCRRKSIVRMRKDRVETRGAKRKRG